MRTTCKALRPRHRVGRWGVILAAAAACGLWGPAPAAAAEPKRVLLLNSYHPGYRWTDDEARGVIAAVGTSPKDVQVYTEYMGTKWTSDPSYFDHLRRAYASKFERIRFDVVVSTDDAALRFLLDYRDELFGRIPVVFCGANDVDPRRFDGHELFTGVNEVADFRSTLDLVLAIHPNVRRVVVLSDSSITGHKIRDQFQRDVRRYQGRLEFEYLGDGPFEAILERLARLGPGSVVFLTVYFSDASGRIIDNDETAARVSRAARVPVYGAWDFTLGHGIVGGMLLSGYEQGATAGRMALRILNGTPVADIPLEMTSVSRFMFDDQQLRRFGVSRLALPPGSTVINAPPSFYALNKALVWAAAGTLAVLAALVVSLLVNQARRRRAEEALRTSEEKFRTLVQNLRIGVFRCTAEAPGTFLQVNPAMDRLLERPVGRSEGLPVTWLFADPAEHAAVLEDVRAHGFVRDREIRLRTAGQEPRVVALSASAAGKDARGDVLWLDGTAEDVTERRRLEDERRRTQKLESLGLLAGGIAHDFNNLLTGITGNLSFAQHLLADGEARDAVQDAMAAASRAGALTQRLLTFAKGGGPVKRRVELSPLVKGSVALSLSGSRSACAVDVPEDLWCVEGDEVQLGQVLSNLVLNADQAMSGGGTIEVRCRNRQIAAPGSEAAPGRYVEIEVRDHGSGIPAENLDKIFDPFFTTKERGRGLGLSTVHSVVKQHGGQVSVRSTPGDGAVFTVLLPSSTCPPAPTSTDGPAAAPEPAAGHGRILVMDDEEAVLTVLRRMLQRLGYTVETAAHGAEAVARYGEACRSGDRFEAAIFDLTIPGGMGGMEAAKGILALDPGAKVIASSGYSHDPVMANHVTYGFVGALKKPFEMEALVHALRAAEERSGLPSGDEGTKGSTAAPAPAPAAPPAR